MRSHALLAAAIAPALALVGCDSARQLPAAGARPPLCVTCHGGELDSSGAPPFSLPRNGAGAIMASGTRFDQTASTTQIEVGAHRRHVETGVSCGACHVVPAQVADPGHLDGLRATVTFKELAAAGNVVPLPWDPAARTCTTYCHGTSLAHGGTNHTPDWLGGPAAGACGTCHFATGVAPPAPHPAGPGAGGVFTSTTSCATCHTETVNADGTINLAGGKHVNGQLDGGGGHLAGYADPGVHGKDARANLPNCATCHGADFGGNGGRAADCNACHAAAGHATWKTECTFCHGDKAGARAGTFASVGDPAVPADRAAPPRGVQDENVITSNAVGAHQVHLTVGPFSNGFKCDQCHGAALPANTDHANGTVAIAWGSVAGLGTTTTPAAGNLPRWDAPGAPANTCANYCHTPRPGDTAPGLLAAPIWNTTGTVVCGSCHGLPPVTATHPVNPACSQCHPAYPDSPTATTVLSASARLTHVNGQLDGGESSGATACLNCHKTDAGTGAAYGKMVSDTTLYHHVLSAETGAFVTYPLTATGRACLQCHADHDVFGPSNASNTAGRGANLRTSIASAPTTTANHASTDFSGTAGICLSCHAAGIAKAAGQKSDGSTTTHPVDGTGFAGSAHAYAVAGSISTGSSAFSAVCMKCHSDQQTASYPERQNGTYRFALHTSVDRRLRNPMGQTTPTDDRSEDHCFRCHSLTTDSSPGGGPAKAVANRDYFGTAAMTVSSQNVFTAFGNSHVSRHNVAGYDLIHQPTEAPAGAGGTKHVECEDCHEPHAARAGARPASNNNLVWGPITGVSGVTPTWGPASWTNATAYAAVTASTYEYQICFKCHSSANTGLASWDATWTDLALEFNPANQSRHPVASALNAAGSGSNSLAASQLLAPWAPGNLMTCSDCHGADAASPAAQGPHGSAVRFMLKGTNRAWPYTVAGATTGTLFAIASSETGLGTANGLFCRNCHPQMNSTASNAIHRHAGLNSSKHSGTNAVSACTGCHLRVPHGGKVSRLIVTTNAPARYKVGTPNLGGFTKQAKDAYTLQNSILSSCSEHRGTGAEAW